MGICMKQLGKPVNQLFADAEQEYMNGLFRFLSAEYGLSVKNIFPATRGFYGETWIIQTESGISFVPKIIRTTGGRLYSRFRHGTAAVFEYIPGELSEDWSTEQLYSRLAKIYRLKTDGITLKNESFGTELIDTFQRLRSLPPIAC